MLKPDWVSPLDWNELCVVLSDLTADFALSLPDGESKRLMSDRQFFDFVEDQIQQKLVSVLETYRAKGMYAGTQSN